MELQDYGVILLDTSSRVFDQISLSTSDVSVLSDPFSDTECDAGLLSKKESNKNTFFNFSSVFKEMIDSSNQPKNGIKSMMAENPDQIRAKNVFKQLKKKVPLLAQLKIVRLNSKELSFGQDVLEPVFEPDEKKTWEDIKNEVFQNRSILKNIRKMTEKEKTRKIMKAQADMEAYETMSGYWRLLTRNSEFEISPPHFDAYGDYEGFIVCQYDNMTETDGWFSKSDGDSKPSIPVAPRIDAEEYDMQHPRRGLALIFNHVNFSKKKDKRHGADLDAERIYKVLEGLDFQVEQHNDLTRRELFYRLEDAATADHTDADCLVIVVMTHGDPNELAAYDYSYNSSKLWEQFTAENCPTMAGKPKLFFIQACRGDNVDLGARVTQTDGNGRISYIIPNLADMIVANATYHGYYAWRSGSQGSWFIQALCRELEEHGKTKEICHILNRVNRRVAITYSSYVPEKPRINGAKQMPNFLSTLTRDLYFRPKTGGK